MSTVTIDRKEMLTKDEILKQILELPADDLRRLERIARYYDTKKPRKDRVVFRHAKSKQIDVQTYTDSGRKSNTIKKWTGPVHCAIPQQDRIVVGGEYVDIMYYDRKINKEAPNGAMMKVPDIESGIIMEKAELTFNPKQKEHLYYYLLFCNYNIANANRDPSKPSFVRPDWQEFKAKKSITEAKAYGDAVRKLEAMDKSQLAILGGIFNIDQTVSIEEQKGVLAQRLNPLTTSSRIPLTDFAELTAGRHWETRGDVRTALTTNKIFLNTQVNTYYWVLPDGSMGQVIIDAPYTGDKEGHLVNHFLDNPVLLARLHNAIGKTRATAEKPELVAALNRTGTENLEQMIDEALNKGYLAYSRFRYILAIDGEYDSGNADKFVIFKHASRVKDGKAALIKEMNAPKGGKLIKRLADWMTRDLQ